MNYLITAGPRSSPDTSSLILCRTQNTSGVNGWMALDREFTQHSRTGTQTRLGYVFHDYLEWLLRTKIRAGCQEVGNLTAYSQNIVVFFMADQ